MPKLAQIKAEITPELSGKMLSEAFPCKIRNEDDKLELHIYDFIGEPDTDSSATQVSQTLSENKGKPVSVRINSTGGFAYDGIAIYNELVQHDAPVDVTITGIAASAASIIAMAGDSIKISENAQIMIHNAWWIALGDANEMRAAAEVLDQLDGLIAATYAARTGESAEDMAAFMADESYFGGKDAVELGLADEVLPSKKKPKPKDHAKEIAARVRSMQMRVRSIETEDAA